MLKISFTIDRLEGNKAVLKSETDTIIWPKDKLPAGAREGSVIVFQLMDDQESAKNQKELAKSMLNEILGAQ